VVAAAPGESKPIFAPPKASNSRPSMVTTGASDAPGVNFYQVESP
jgi:hypothetical protein